MTDQTEDVPYILVLGTADWNQPIATNQHYIVRELLRNEFARVDFVESLGLRRPQLTWRDLKRIARRLFGHWTVGKREEARPERWRRQPEGLQVISPIVVPIHSKSTATINRLLLRRAVKDWIAYEGAKTLWTYTPRTYGLESEASAVVYHCVDLLGKVPGIDENVIEGAERLLALNGTVAVATSLVVKRHLEDIGFKEVNLWENVADTETISLTTAQTAARVSHRVIFAGNLSPTKIDYSLLESLADAGLDVVIAGPRAEGGGDDSKLFRSLLSHGVTYLGMMTLEHLARELSRATVGIVPYAINDYTKGVSPLKTYEYLAAGLSVVATDLPGVTPDDKDIFVETNKISFVNRVLALTASNSPEDISRRTTTAQSHSWIGRGLEARALAREVQRQ